MPELPPTGAPRTPRAILLSIGAELLLGETVDTNAAFIGARLAELGLELTAVRQLADDRELIARAFAAARGEADLVLATGGLGPTHDDLTREGLADALGEVLAPDPELEAMLRQRFAAYGRMPPSNLRQALRIPSAAVLANPIGSAPGWWVDRDGIVVAVMPGVPSEMRRMFDEELTPRLGQRFALRPLQTRTVKTFGIGESAVAERVGDLLTAPGPDIAAGIYARDDGVHLRFSTRDEAAALDPPASRAAEILGQAVWGTDADQLADAALSALGRAGARTVASWEADTDGALLAILASATTADADDDDDDDADREVARYVGGMLDCGGSVSAPLADAVIQLSLLPQDAHGRSRVRVSVSGTVTLEPVELRIHGSGPQRLRRAAFAALDQLRRIR